MIVITCLAIAAVITLAIFLFDPIKDYLHSIPPRESVQSINRRMYEEIREIDEKYIETIKAINVAAGQSWRNDYL